MRKAGLAWALAVAVLSTVLGAFVSPPLAGAETVREGTLRETIRENLARRESVTTYSLESGGTTVPLVPTRSASADAGDRVVVRGEMREGRLVGSIARPGAAASVSPIPGPIFSGPRRVLVLLVKFAGDPAEPWSPSVTREKIFTGASSADVFFQEESRSIISLGGKVNPEDGDVFGWFTLDSSGAGCSQNTWSDEALDRAVESGVSLTGYHHLVFAYTQRSGCFWNGMATVGGNSGTVHLNGNVSVRTIAHEFGHNFSFYHAGSRSCTRGGDRVQISDTCSVNPYGDVFDAMGNVATRHNNGWNLAKIGMLGAANVVTATSDGTYSLRAALSLDPAPTILRIPRTTNQGGTVTSWYYLEIRQQGGVFESANDASMNGVSIRIAPITSFDDTGFQTETQLIDANPSTSTFTDAPLQVGNTFYDGKVRVKTLTAGGGAASVSVELDVPDEEPPSAPSNLTASLNATDVKLQWGASADNLGVARYVIFRDGLEIGTSSTTTFTDKSATIGQHTYVVYAEDAAGNRSLESVPKEVTIADLSPPTAPTDLSAVQDSSGVRLQWGASTDDVGVAHYVVFRDGLEIGTTPTTSFTDSGATAGQHAYTVNAEDEAGNRGPVSSVFVFNVVAGPGDGPADPEDGDSGKKPLRVKPTLRWQRQPNGDFAIEVDATRNPGVERVNLWLDGKLVRSRKGPVLRLVWDPRAARCARAHRLIANAYERTGSGRVIATTRVRVIRFPNLVGTCHGRAEAGRRR